MQNFVGRAAACDRRGPAPTPRFSPSHAPVPARAPRRSPSPAPRCRRTRPSATPRGRPAAFGAAPPSGGGENGHDHPTLRSAIVRADSPTPCQHHSDVFLRRDAAQSLNPPSDLERFRQRLLELSKPCLSMPPKIYASDNFRLLWRGLFGRQSACSEFMP